MKPKRTSSFLVCLLPAVAVLAGVPAEARRRRPRKSTEPPARPRSSPQITMDTVRRKLALARRSLEYVERSAARPKLTVELRAIARGIEASGGGADPKRLFEEASSLRRRIILSHPALGFDRLLVNRNPPPLYSHNCDQYLGRHSRTGKGLVILEDWKSGSPRATTILRDKLPPGAICKPKLSWDAKRLLFAFCDHTEKEKVRRRYFIYEAALDGSWARQLTGTADDPMARWGGRETVLIEDGDPCYLPEGGIAFVSSRSQGFGRCHNGRYTPSFLLYRAGPDGRNIRQVSFGEANENDPVVLDDGRIVYTRWDYINRNVTMFHMLWWTRPDGTNVANFYGSNTEKPWMISETAPVPGSQKVVALATGHHSFSTGCIVLIDPVVGEDGEAPIRRITPEIGWFEAEKLTARGCYSTPWPLTEDLFLAAYSPQVIPKQGRTPADDYAIYLVDSFGGRELIYRDPDMSCFSPTPVLVRPKPRAISSVLPSRPAGDTGVCSIQDVYLNRHDPEGVIRRGEIKALRINQMIGQPATNKNNSQPSLVRHEIAKKILGTVPVGADGSVTFRAPAEIPLQLQALDANGMAVMTMRSFLYLQPGETRSCIGCHEQRGTAPPVRTKALATAPVGITPPEGPSYEGGFSYARTVQPVLDRYCIRCHGLEKKEKGLDLTGVLEPSKLPRGFMKSLLGEVSRSYNAFFNRPGLLKIAMFKKETHVSVPRDYFAAAGKLAPMLVKGEKGHNKAGLDRKSMQRIIDWLDLNSQCFGDYSWNRIEQRKPDPAGERALRAFIKNRFGAKLAAGPFATLVNVAQPDESRILKAPLAVEAGGWGQIPNGWQSTDDAGYRRMAELVAASIRPLEYRDINGTCARAEKGGKCVCGSCWVREAEAAYRKKLAEARAISKAR